MDRLKDCGHAVVVGFLPQNRVLSPFEQTRAWQLYGVAELAVPRHGAARRPVVVASHRVALGKAEVGKGDLAAKKALWHDRVRNRRLARVARAVAAGDSATLGADFPAVAAAIDDSGAKSVLVLAEELDQAEAIAALLKGWPLVSGLDGHDAPPPTPKRPRRRHRAGRPQARRRLVRRRRARRPRPGAAAPAPRLARRRDPDPRPLLLIDAEDSGRPLPALWSRSRRRAYLDAGWARAGCDPDLEIWRRIENPARRGTGS